MIVTLDCGCVIDDALKSTAHVDEATHHGARSKGDVEYKKHHYYLHTSPEAYCYHCDRYRPCLCDVKAEA